MWSLVSGTCRKSAALLHGRMSVLCRQRPQQTARFLSVAASKQTLSPDGTLLVSLSPDQHQHINTTWLRENCQCDQCYNHQTFQRNAIFYEFSPENTAVGNYQVQDQLLNVQWKDGHRSEFPLDWLRRNLAVDAPEKITKALWDAELISRVELPRVGFEDLCQKDESKKVLLSSLLKYGIGFVDGVEASVEGTEAAAEQVCFVQETLFGGMWSFTADLARSDTAYTSGTLGAHNDTTYLSLPAGIQVFHCTKHDGEGGETLLVDGFHATRTLQETHPDYFDLLSSTIVEHHYLEPGTHVNSLLPILKTNPITGEQEWIRYNHYDRAPLTKLPQEDIGKFYKALAELSRLITAPSGEFWVKLKPGTVLFVDNWRVLHGRAAFTGSRHVCGCYLPRDDWLSKARVLGLAP